MADIGERLREVRDVVRVDWEPGRARAAERGLAGRRATKTRRRAVAASMALGVAALFAVLFVGRGHAEPTLVLQARVGGAAATWGASTTAPRAMTLADGSTIRPRAGALILAERVSPANVVVAVAKGGASFDVTHDEARLFRVAAGDVSVEVLGTAFSVERVDAKVRVAVDRGRVRVRWGNEERELGVGEHGTFPPEKQIATSNAIDDDPPRAALPKPIGASDEVNAAAQKQGPAPSDNPTWHALAKAGDYDKAYEALHDAAAVPPRDVPEELLLAADVARLSGHPAQAVDPLRRVARDHRGDPRAPLAAFTLGRVLLDSLGRPREAADAFADARALGGGGLGEEALAREVEARSRAGDADHARSLAEQYVARFPDGKRTRTVKKFGGIE